MSLNRHSILLSAPSITPLSDPIPLITLPVVLGKHSLFMYQHRIDLKCHSEYSFAQPTSTLFPDRPAFGGTCYSNIDMATPVRVTAYGSSSVTATSLFTATVTNAQAYAYPLEGFASGVAEVQSITSSGRSSATSPSSSSGASAAATYTVSHD